MKKLKHTFLCLMATLFIICSLTIFPAIKTYAESAGITIAVSSTSVNVGDTITVTVSITGDTALGAYTYSLSYDSSILEYTSSLGEAENGSITYNGSGDKSSSSAYTTFSFKAIASGSASIYTEKSFVNTADDVACSVSNASAIISVLGDSSAASSEDTEQATEITSESTTENSTDKNDDDNSDKTDDCALKSLKITPGTLKPAFSQAVTEYEIAVTEGTEKLNIDAAAANDKSAVSINGNSGFEAGKTKDVKITVVAENGDKRTYTIKVTCESEKPEPVSVVIDGTTYHFNTDYTKTDIPNGFTENMSSYNGSDIIVYKSPNNLVSCAYLINDAAEGHWYTIDTATGSIAPMIKIQPAGSTYIISDHKEDNVPSGYSPIAYLIDNTEVTAYRKNEQDTVILIYAMNTSGSEGWYFYDTIDGTFIRYEGFTNSAVQEETGVSNFINRHKFVIMLIAIIILVFICVIAIALALTMKKIIKEYEAEKKPHDRKATTDEAAAEYTDAAPIDDSDYYNTEDTDIDSSDNINNDNDESTDTENPDSIHDANTESVDADSLDNIRNADEENTDTENTDSIRNTDEENTDTDSSDSIHSADAKNVEDGEGTVSDSKKHPAKSQFVVPTITSTTPTHEGPLLINPLAASKNTEEATDNDLTEVKIDEEPSYSENSEIQPDGFVEHTKKSAEEKKTVLHTGGNGPLSTADLSEIINIAESIVNSENDSKCDEEDNAADSDEE